MKKIFQLLLFAVATLVAARAQTVSITGPVGIVSSPVTITGTFSGAVTLPINVTANNSAANMANSGQATSSGNTWSIVWTPTQSGDYTIRAAGTGTNQPFASTVLTVSGPPSVTLSLAGGGGSVPTGSTRFLNALATDDGAIDRVEFYLDGNLIGTSTAPGGGSIYTIPFTAPDVVGFHQVSARAFDNAGNLGTSNFVTVQVTTPIGSAPSVGVLTPATGAFLPVNTATTVTVSAADSDGTITGVQVFANGVSVGNATFASGVWSISWTPTVPGTYSISAIATDDKANASLAPAVAVTITDNTSPAITLSLTPTAPTLPTGATRNIVAAVTPSAGRAIVRVEFFVNGTKVAEDNTAPYTYRFVAPSTTGTYVVSVRATDNTGLARDAQQTFTVIPAVGLPPTVSLLTPTNNFSVVPGTAVSLAATSTAPGGTVTSVQFYVNGSPSGNAVTAAPYISSFTPTLPGSYTIDAIAADDRGNTTISNSATITAAFTTPTIAFTSPNPNATARATPNVPLTLTATATVGTGSAVLLVEFLLDGVQIGARTTATNVATGSYSFAWTPTTAQLGQHVLTARVTDTNSQVATSLPVSVNVANTVGTPPTVTISVTPIPAQGLQTLSQVNFIANAFANGTATLSSVEFFLNDVSIGLAAREQTTNLYRVAYDFSRFDFSALTTTLTDANGNPRYTVALYAIARDSNNNQTVSATNNLTINTATSAPPSLSLTALSPATVTQGTQFFIGPIFSDSDGTVASIQLYANGAITSTLGNPQLGQILTYNAATSGRFNLFAVATDDTGNTVISTPSIVVNVTAITAPTTTLTRPADDATVTTVAAPVFLEATAVGGDATQIPTVAFLATGSTGARTTINATRVGTTTTYRAIWSPTTADTYSVVSTATVSNVSGTSTASRRVVVTNVTGIAPTVTIALIPTSTTVTTASTANLVATASDSDGSVIDVEFFINRNSVGHAVRDQLTNTWRLPFSFAGVPVASNTEYVALVRDSAGNVAASPTTILNVIAAQSIAPNISINASSTNVAFSRQVQLTANARDTDGTIAQVQYFANGSSIGTTGNSGTNFLVNWTPNQSGTFNVYAVATDSAVNGVQNTVVSSTIQVTVRRNNPVQDDSAFILQTYADIANNTNVNTNILADLDSQLSAGTLSRAQLVANLVVDPSNTGFTAPVNLLATYYVIMGQWPTPANYNTLLPTARGSLSNAVGAILTSSEYFAKYPEHIVPTVVLLNSPTSVIPEATFLNRLWQNAGLSGAPQPLDHTRFISNDTTFGGTLGRGYGVVGLNTAIAEFVTNTNSTNTALMARAKAAALYYQLDRPVPAASLTAQQITDGIAARVADLVKLPDLVSQADSVLKDVLYSYRYVTITKHPQSLTVAPRSGALFSVEALGAPPLAYQWLLNGAPIAGATSALLSLTNVDTTKVGTYTVVVTSSAATATSDPAILDLSSTPTRLLNISTRGTTGNGASVLIGGFVVSGTANQTRQMLIRVVGPTIAAAPFNVTGALADPRLEVYGANPNTPILVNDNWGNQTGGAAAVTAIQQAATRVGAFALPNNSNDAAVLATLAPGSYTVQAKNAANNNAGIVLIEVYDASPPAAGGSKPINVSTRGDVGTGNNILIAGFVVNGAVSRRILIRGVGPTLTRFGLGANAVLADPQITLVDQSSGKAIKTNDDWSSGDDAAIIAAAAVTGGAFPLANGSKDAAMLIMLPPGTYTVQLSGVGNSTGIGIVEVYDVDP